MSKGSALTFRPVTPANRQDFIDLFARRGGPSYCWCMVWRVTGDKIKLRGKDRKPLILERIDRRETIGLLGYRDGTPVAWVSVAPRAGFRRGLGGPEAEEGRNTWSIACLYVQRALRGEGLAHQLIAAAVAYAGKRGADVIEAYPVEPDSPSYRYMGFVPAYEKAGFAAVGRVGSRRHVMRLVP